MEALRVRRVELHLHLSDLTLAVHEPRVDNSGLLQGTVLKRHRVRKAGRAPAAGAAGLGASADDDAADPGAYVGWEDLAIGKDVVLYGRCVAVVSACVRVCVAASWCCRRRGGWDGLDGMRRVPLQASG
jgi:hypothetical protein